MTRIFHPALLVVSLVTVALPSEAQMPATPPHPAEPPAVTAAMSAAFGEVERLTARIMLLDQRLADLDAYARRCGDQPGCFLPVKPASPQ